MTTKALPRSVRNNNPLNIERNERNKWVGKKTTNLTEWQRKESRFEIFESMAYGFRAAAVLIQNYQDKKQVRTIHDLIHTWAPDEENDTVAYIEAISRRTGFLPNEILDLHSYHTLRPIIEAMAAHETGNDLNTNKPYKFNPADIDEGLRRAGVIKPKQPVPAQTAGTAVLGAFAMSDLAGVLPQVTTAMTQAEEHITSGQVVRLVFGVTMVALAVGMAIYQLRQRKVERK